MKTHEQLFLQQMENWPEAAARYRQLSAVQSRTLELNEQSFVLQSNPKRIQSSLADVSSESLKQRPCFLCPENRPNKQQSIPLNFDPSFEILVNPFPVAQRHYTIAGPHLPQRLHGHLNTFFSTAQIMNDCVVFFNGAHAGASAPDHLHFQSIMKGILPLEKDIHHWKGPFMQRLMKYEDNTVSCLSGIGRNRLVYGGQSPVLTDELG
jgi:ATP adenylyltransferase/5',5'''-P-1,P-4-tetraphosphate phosphorylase II